jgi:hypothetical protein
MSGNVDTARLVYPRKALPTIKLEAYNGSTSLETFLAKLNNCSDYHQWSERDTLCHEGESRWSCWSSTMGD